MGESVLLRRIGIVLALCVWLAPPTFARPDAATLEQALDKAYNSFLGDESGATAGYIAALEQADPDKFGLVAVTTDGRIVARGDVNEPFAIMSAAKPFTLALLMQQQGTQVVLERIGVEPTGLPFSALSGIDKAAAEPLNPMVNAGAIITVSLLKFAEPEQLWPAILDYYSALAGEPLALMGDVYESVSTSNYGNRAIVNLLKLNDWLGTDPTRTLDVYNKQSSVGVTAKQLAVMGATLANSGVNPLTGDRLVDAAHVDELLSVMMLSGFYNESGQWAYQAGLPAKSGVGGGIIAIVPGQMAIAGFSPRLNEAGNSVRATRAIAQVANELDLSIFSARRLPAQD